MAYRTSIYGALKSALTYNDTAQVVPTLLGTLRIPEPVIAKRALILARTPPMTMGKTEEELHLGSQPVTIAFSNITLQSTGRVDAFALQEIIGLIQLSVHQLGSAVKILKDVPLPVPYGAPRDSNIPYVDYMFFHPHNHLTAAINQYPYMLMWLVSPGLINRNIWEDWSPPTILGDFWSPEMRTAANMTKCVRRQAARLRCPQVCVFDGLTLLRFDFHATTTAGIMDPECKVTLDIVYDYSASRRTERSTIREVVFQSLLAGIRRVTCTVLSGRAGMATGPSLRAILRGCTVVDKPWVGLREYVREDGTKVEVEIVLVKAPGLGRSDGSLMFRWMCEYSAGEEGFEYPLSNAFWGWIEMSLWSWS